MRAFRAFPPRPCPAPALAGRWRSPPRRAAPAGWPSPADNRPAAELLRQALAPRSSVRLATVMPAGCWAAKWVTTSSIISPAPMNSTFSSRMLGEDLQGQLDASGGHRHRVGANRRLAAHRLAAEKVFERACSAARPARRIARRRAPRPDLADNLGFAQHHGVQPGGHPKSVAGGGFGVQQIQIRPQGVHVQAAIARQPVQHGVDVLGAGINSVRLQVDRMAASCAAARARSVRSRSWCPPAARPGKPAVRGWRAGRCGGWSKTKGDQLHADERRNLSGRGHFTRRCAADHD